MLFEPHRNSNIPMVRIMVRVSDGVRVPVSDGVKVRGAIPAGNGPIGPE